jgi:hypothetical protein
VARPPDQGRDLVAAILAIGLAASLIIMVGAVFYDAIRSDTPGLSENATQVVIAAFTGITGVLGGYIGGRAVERAHQLDAERRQLQERQEQDLPDE